MKIAFMGTPDFAVCCLAKLIEAKHEIGLVITQPDKAKDRGKKVKFTPVKELAVNNNIDVYQPIKIRNDKETISALKSYKPDIIVVVAYGQIIPKGILDLAKFGAINVHASILPELRGASPIQHAIIRGKSVTGVTIMQMSEGLDTGDMLTKAEIKIDNRNYEKLHDALAILGAELLVDTLPKIEKGEVIPKKQDDSKSTYAGLIKKQDGKIDFTKSPVEIVNLIRGFDPWPGAFFKYKDMVVKAWKAEIPSENEIDDTVNFKNKSNGEIVKVDNKGIVVKSGGFPLRITEIQVPGKKRVLVKDYIKGNSLEEGEILK